jgi:hypothetical protein
MRTTLTIFALMFVVSFSASAQAPDSETALLDHLTGSWTLRGTIAGRKTTHDIESDWVLRREYIRIHETSREKNAKGQAAYEAIVFIAWDNAAREYRCLWLDSTGGGGLSPQAIAHGKRSSDEIVFLFNDSDGSIHTSFAYSKSTDTWQWRIDNESNGKLSPFARVKLTRK